MFDVCVSKSKAQRPEEQLDKSMKKSSFKAKNGPPPIAHLHGTECYVALGVHNLANISLYRLRYD